MFKTYQFIIQLRVTVLLCVCRLSHLCTLLKPLDGMRCHLAGTLVWSQLPSNTVLGRSPSPHGKWRFGGRNPQFVAMAPPVFMLMHGSLQSFSRDADAAAINVILLFISR